jgi:hypothetical protein
LRSELDGDEGECFKRLLSMVTVLVEHDDQNYIVLETGNGHFYRCFVAPGATRTAWRYGRPVIALDSCHTKSRFRMTLLIAYILDANNEILP